LDIREDGSDQLEEDRSLEFFHNSLYREDNGMSSRAKREAEGLRSVISTVQGQTPRGFCTVEISQSLRSFEMTINAMY
jgi:hypothetical protein